MSTTTSKRSAKRVFDNAAVGALACLLLLLAVPVALALGAVAVAVVAAALVIAAVTAVAALPAVVVSELTTRRGRGR